MTKADAIIRAEALTALQKHPGWAIYSEHLQKLTDHTYRMMVNAKGTEELAKHTYAYILLKELGTAPQNTVAVLEATLANTK